MAETLGGTVFLLLVVGLLVAVVWRIRRTRRVTVFEDIPVPGAPASSVDRMVAAGLGGIAGIDLRIAGQGRYAVVLRRCPVWVALPIFLLFPIGLVFLAVREDVLLEIVVFETADGAVVRMTGTSESDVVDKIRLVLTSQPVT
jgi:hypothetical protein